MFHFPTRLSEVPSISEIHSNTHILAAQVHRPALCKDEWLAPFGQQEVSEGMDLAPQRQQVHQHRVRVQQPAAQVLADQPHSEKAVRYFNCALFQLSLSL